MNKILLVAVALFLILAPSQALAQDSARVTLDDQTCGRFKAMVTDVPAGTTVRFQLGHDLVKIVHITEQDTAAAFDSGPFPASDWGFSVRVNDQVILDKIVTVKECGATAGELPFTGQRLVLWLAVMVLILSGIVLLLMTRRRR